MCAIGCAIPDDLYDPEMEGIRFYFLEKTHPILHEALKPLNVGLSNETNEKIMGILDSPSFSRWGDVLQYVHDYTPLYRWKEVLEKLREVIINQ